MYPFHPTTPHPRARPPPDTTCRTISVVAGTQQLAARGAPHSYDCSQKCLGLELSQSICRIMASNFLVDHSTSFRLKAFSFRQNVSWCSPSLLWGTLARSRQGPLEQSSF